MEDAILNVLRRSLPNGVSDRVLRQELRIPEASTYAQERELHDALENLSDIGLIRIMGTQESVRYILTK
ncbi:MAG: hypothetical protein IJI97_06490 [Clostridia bacterium]|nr:hypothetical protein [Clostridia bacterium]